MSVLLQRIPNPTQITPKEFAQKFGDFDFDGSAGGKDMSDFFDAAYKCINASDKSRDRAEAMLDTAKIMGLYSSSYFPKLDPKIVAFQIILRLMKPERVNQREFGLCGPAHVTILLLKSRPVSYVRMAWDLLTKGKTVGEDGFEIIPDEYVRDFEPLESIPQADWLLAASLRNSKTPIPPGKERGEYGGTQGPDVFAYFLHAGYSEIVALSCYKQGVEWLGHTVLSSQYEQYHPEGLRKGIVGSGKLYDPETNFRLACQLRGEGWRLMLKINSGLFSLKPISAQLLATARAGSAKAQEAVDEYNQKRKTDTSEKTYLGGLISGQNVNHWVVAKKISVTSGIVGLSVYTWGTQRTVEVDLTTDEFSNCYGGFVAARG
jgi:hypothetical protein